MKSSLIKKHDKHKSHSCSPEQDLVKKREKYRDVFSVGARSVQGRQHQLKSSNTCDNSQ